MATEQDSLNTEPYTFTVAEQVKFSSTDKDIPAIPPIEDLLSTPPTSQDEGYGHGFSIDSMIVTLHVSTLGK